MGQMIRAGTFFARRAGLCAVYAAACAALMATTGAQAQSTGGNAVTGVLRGVTSLFGGRSASPATLPTSTIGIRGLGAEDLANAQPNPGAVGQMEALRVDETQARGFAADAALAPVTVQALPTPARAGGANPTETAP